MNKLLLTPEEAAEALGIGRTKVYELMAKGRLASVHIDKSRRIHLDAVNAFIASLEVDAAIAAPTANRRIVR